MKKILFVMSALGIFLSFDACRVSETAQQEGSSSLLWKISGDNLPGVSYVYGTIHIQDKRIFSYGENVRNAFKNANQVAVEVLLDEINPASAMQLMLMKDSTLDMLMSDTEYQRLAENYQKVTGADISTAATMKPFFLSANLIQAIAPGDMPVPLDLYFIQKAREQNKTVIGLETLEEQIAIIDGISYSTQAEMLLESLEDVDELKQQFNKLVDAYLSMDKDAIVKLTDDPTIPAGFMDELLNKRNKIMVERMEKAIQHAETFTAVGAAHLYGKDGIVSMLKDRGYTVEAVPVTFN
jgi:uncharacterized protein YbaP (TraB family)